MKYVEVKNAKAIVTLGVNFDCKEMARVRDEVKEVIGKGVTEAVFDFVKTEYIDSSGVGLVVRIAQELGGKRNEKKKVEIINLGDDVYQVFNSYKLIPILMK